MRVAAAGLAAIIAAIAIALDAGARADQVNPFPSPSPVASVLPGSGGYASIGFSSLSAAGGDVPISIGTATPYPFKSVRATGYSIDVFSRISASYSARLRFQDTNIHGDDDPIASRFDASILYNGGPRFGVGLSYASVQRSNVETSSNGLGATAMLIPDFTKHVSTYGSVGFYPSLEGPGGRRGSLETVDGGLVFANRGTSDTFERLGIIDQTFSPSTTSPVTLLGIEFGIGANF